VVIGLGIGTMHYTGMRAYLTTGTVNWDPELVLASIALGVVFSAAALLSFQVRSPARLFAATSLLTIAICSLHFTAMGAAIITPYPTIIVYPSFMDNTTMALAVAGVTLLVMLAGLAAALIEKQTVQESIVRPASAEHIRKVLAAGFAEVEVFAEFVPDEAEAKVTPITAAKRRSRSSGSSAA
jgi:hypothetical protein